MAKIKGKFIILAGNLMSLYKTQLAFANKYLRNKTGKIHKELDPEGWYDTNIFEIFMRKYAEGSVSKDKAIETLGRNVFPTIKNTVGLPSDIKTAYDLIIFEAKAFELNHKGDDVIPRQFVKKQEGHVIVKAPAPGYNQILYLGVFKGILEMFGINRGIVKMIKGEPDFEYEIKW